MTARFISLLLFFCAMPLAIFPAGIYEGKKVQKIEISIGKSHEGKEIQSVQSLLKTKEGSPFSQADFDEDLKVLSKEFDTIEPTLSPTGDDVDLKLVLTPKPTISKIEFLGNQAITNDKLMGELGIKTSSTFDREVFSKAIQRIKSYYLKKGYFDAVCDYDAKKSEDGKRVDITIKIAEGKAGWIEEIRFINFTKDEQASLLEQMNTKEYSLWTSWLTNEGTHKPEVLHMDEVTILNYLHNEGYMDAKIETKIVDGTTPERIIIEIRGDKGDLYRIGNVGVSGNKIFPTDTISKAISLKSGDIYGPEKVTNSVQVIAEMYGRKGYIDVAVLPNAKVRLTEKIYDVSFEVEEGQKFRVGIIKVLGNSRTEGPVILHESLLTPGEIFDSTLLSKTEERLKNTNYFTSVNVYAVKSKESVVPSSNLRDVIIEVQENPTTAHFVVGVGFSTTEKITGHLGLNESNFNMKGFSTLFSKGMKGLRGGGEFLAFDAAIGSKLLSYTLAWTKPYVFDTPWIFGVELNRYKNEYSAKSYTIKSYSATLSANYPVNAFVRFGTHYRITDQNIFLHENHERAASALFRETKNGGMVSAIGAELHYDSRNHPMMPTNGLHSIVGMEYAGLGGDHHFAKLYYQNGYYFSPYSGGLLLLRGDVQFIRTLWGEKRQDIPLPERLYNGGEQSIRGYYFNTVGPKFHDKMRTPRGGFSDVLLSAEFDQKLMKKLDGFVFFDAGNAYWNQFYLGKLQASWGFGIKLKIQENSVPIVLGLGYPINPQNKHDVKHFFISFSTNF